MSDVKFYSALRFKFSKDYTNPTEMLSIVRGIIGEPDEIEFESVWDGKEYVDTEDVEYFEYPRKANSYTLVRNDNEVYYLDYMLYDEKSSDCDVDCVIDLENLLSIQHKTKELFGDLITGKCRVIVLEWYTGCEMPVEF